MLLFLSSLHIEQISLSDRPKPIEVHTDQGFLRLTILSPSEATLEWSYELPGESFQLGTMEHSLIAAVEARFEKRAAAVTELVARLSPALPALNGRSTFENNDKSKFGWSYRFNDEAFELDPATSKGNNVWRMELGGFSQGGLAAWLDSELQLLSRYRLEQTHFLLECVWAKQRLGRHIPKA